MKSKLTRISIVWIVWAILALCSTILYEYLYDIGFIYDNEYSPGQSPWNSRKVIFAVMSIVYTILTIVKTVVIAEEKTSKKTNNNE